MEVREENKSKANKQTTHTDTRVHYRRPRRSHGRAVHSVTR